MSTEIRKYFDIFITKRVSNKEIPNYYWRLIDYIQKKDFEAYFKEQDIRFELLALQKNLNQEMDMIYKKDTRKNIFGNITVKDELPKWMAEVNKSFHLMIPDEDNIITKYFKSCRLNGKNKLVRTKNQDTLLDQLSKSYEKTFNVSILKKVEILEGDVKNNNNLKIFNKKGEVFLMDLQHLSALNSMDFISEKNSSVDMDEYFQKDGNIFMNKD